MSDYGDAPFYCLMIVCNSGSEFRLFGTKQQFSPYVDTFSEGPIVGSEWSDSDVFDIKAICDSCDRAPSRMAIKAQTIQAMYLYLYS